MLRLYSCSINIRPNKKKFFDQFLFRFFFLSDSTLKRYIFIFFDKNIVNTDVSLDIAVASSKLKVGGGGD